MNTMKKDTQQDTETKAETETEKKDDIREGRKSLTMPKSYGGKNKVRYIEGTKALKDGCWLSDK